MRQITSIEAYRAIVKNLGKRQAAVLRVLEKGRPLTNLELSTMAGLPINSVTPRVFELRKLGLVEEAGKRPCQMSGRMAIAWRVVDPPREPVQGSLFPNQRL